MSQNKKIIAICSGLVLTASLLGGGVYYAHKADKSFFGDNQTTTTKLSDESTTTTISSTTTLITINESPSVSITSPLQGETLKDGNKILVSTNNIVDKVSVSVISDKWGEVYNTKVNSENNIILTFVPNITLTPGDSGRIIVKLEKDGSILKEESIWVNF